MKSNLGKRNMFQEDFDSRGTCNCSVLCGVMDALVVANNTIFICNSQTKVPYSPVPLND